MVSFPLTAWRRGFAAVAVLATAAPLPAFYGVGGFLPGDAVDAQSDLTRYSFSVPHALKRYGGTLNPAYRHSSHDGAGNEVNRNDAGASLFAFAQFADVRIGAVTQNDARVIGSGAQALDSASKLMVSYLMSFVSFGVEAGAFRSTVDSPRDNWGVTGAVSASVYSGNWGLDLVWRGVRPNGSAAAPLPLAASDARALYQSTGSDADLYSLRWRYDASFHWRATLAGNYLRSAYADILTGAHTWRYRANAMQVLFGASYYVNLLAGAPGQILHRVDQVNLPVTLILEHRKSIFYVGGSSPLFNRTMTSTDTVQSAVFRFEPRLAYVYRFNGRWWAGLSVADISASYTSAVGNSPITREIRAAFQITYNLVPFGYDDELPQSDNLLLAIR